MIVKAHQAVRQLHLRHMATRAFAARDWASLGIRATDGLSARVLRSMTRQTLSIIGSLVRREVLMRVVARNAADSRVGAIETFAARQPIRLKTDIDFAAPVAPDDRFPGAVTLAAKIRYVFGGQFFQIRRRAFKSFTLKR